MTVPSYQVTLNHRDSILEVAMTGFWTLDLLSAYLAEVKMRTQSLRSRGEWFGILVDNTGFPVQSRAVSEALTLTVERSSQTHRAPTALVAKGALSRLQAQRIGASDTVRVFEALGDARTWILSQKPAMCP